MKCGVRWQCYMPHYSFDLFKMTAREIHITDMKTGEKLTNFSKFENGGIVLADRIYGTLTGIAHLQALGADYVLRIRGGAFTLYNEKNLKIDLFKRLNREKQPKYPQNV